MLKKCVLIVEDEPYVSQILKIKLEENGFRVLVAPNGKEGLKMLRAQKIDVLLLDLLMPVLNGFRVLEEMQRTHITVPTIVLTNLGQKDDLEQIRQYPDVDYLIKSDTPLSAILEKVRSKL